MKCMLIKTFWLLKKLSVCKKKFVATKVVIRNQNLKNKTIQRPKTKGQTICYKTLLRKTKDWTTRTTLKTRGVLRYSGTVAVPAPQVVLIVLPLLQW